MDSKLVVEQMSGRWKVKHPDLKPLARKATALVGEFEQVDFEWVPRAENSHADRLANEAMDAAAPGSRVAGARTAGRRGGRGPRGRPLPDPAADRRRSGCGRRRRCGRTADADGRRRADADGVDTTPTWQDPAAALPHPRDGEPTRFVVVRHGETTWGAQARFAGRKDVSLTPAAGGRPRRWPAGSRVWRRPWC